MIGRVLLDVRQVNVVCKMQTREQNRKKKWNMAYRNKKKEKNAEKQTVKKKTQKGDEEENLTK